MSAAPVTVASTDGVMIRLHDLGGDGAPILFAHATGFHGRVWQPCASHLRDLHAFAPDLRGHGDSTAPDDESFAWSGFGDDVLAVVDHLVSMGAVGPDGLVAAGHSKGGAALLMAEIRRPGTFRALYLYEPIVFPPLGARLTGSNPLAEGARRRRAVFDSYDAAYENYAAKPPLDVLHPDALRAYVDHGFAEQTDGTVRLKCRPEVEAAVFEMGAQHDTFAHLGAVSIPVTVAIGAEIPFTPASFGPPIVEALPNSRLEHHRDLGHFGPLEDPAAIAAAIRTALSTDADAEEAAAPPSPAP